MKKVNDVDCKDANDFFRALRYAAPLARILVNRDEKKAEELEARVHIPEDRAKIIQRREGYVYEMATLVWVQNGPKLGLGIKHFQVDNPYQSRQISVFSEPSARFARRSRIVGREMLGAW